MTWTSPQDGVPLCTDVAAHVGSSISSASIAASCAAVTSATSAAASSSSRASSTPSDESRAARHEQSCARALLLHPTDRHFKPTSALSGKWASAEARAKSSPPSDSSAPPPQGRGDVRA
eukprot:scaffold272625_cov26-Tisochrysis_lutea.AAC.3